MPCRLVYVCSTLKVYYQQVVPGRLVDLRAKPKELCSQAMLKDQCSVNEYLIAEAMTAECSSVRPLATINCTHRRRKRR